VYEIAPPRVKQYLQAEINFVLQRIKPTDRVLELGCGYGRVLKRLIEKAATVVGIDTSKDNVRLAKEIIGDTESCQIFIMNAIDLKFDNCEFDKVICIQNGISAFHVDPHELLAEAVRVTRAGGTLLLSSYSDKFWEHRLHWFKQQAEHHLIGEIDEVATGNGVIICKDGFSATTFTAEDFLTLAANFFVTAKIHEVDESSLCCEITVL